MLVLSRKQGEGIVIRTDAGDVTVTATQITGGRCRLGITAPDEVRILRTELERGERLGANLRRFSGMAAVRCECDCDGCRCICGEPEESTADQDAREFSNWMKGR